MSSGLRVGMLVSVPMPPQEGIGTYAHSLARQLIKMGHQPTLLTRGRTGHVRRSVVAGVPVLELPFVPAYPVHVHFHGMFVQRFLTSRARDFDIVHAHSPLVPPIHGPWPVVTTVHSLIAADGRATKIEDARSLAIRLQTPISERLERRLLRSSAAVVVVNPLLVAAVAAEAGFEVPVRVCANGVDVDQFPPGPDIRLHQNALAVGRLVHGKGFEDLIVAWATVVSTHPGAHLTIVGEGPLRSRLEKLAMSFGIGQEVEFVGAITADRRGDLVELYQQVRVVVQPSHHEGLSTVLLEAMACSTPVIATAVGAHPTLIADGVNGRLVPPRQPTALAQAVNDLLADPVRAAQLGRRGRLTVAETYDWAIVARSYVSLYEELVLRAPNRRGGQSGLRSTAASLGEPLDDHQLELCGDPSRAAKVMRR